jgi:hypothetical protein
VVRVRCWWCRVVMIIGCDWGVEEETWSCVELELIGI